MTGLFGENEMTPVCEKNQNRRYEMLLQSMIETARSKKTNRWVDDLTCKSIGNTMTEHQIKTS
jgi:hypothetical protein